MSDGSSWSRAKPQQSGQHHVMQPDAGFEAQGFGVPTNFPLQNPFQQARAQNQPFNQPQNQNWFGLSNANNMVNGSVNGNDSTNRQANNNTFNAVFSAFPAPHSQPFETNPGSAFARTTAQQPFTNNFSSGSSGSSGSPFQFPQSTSRQQQNPPKSAFTSISSSAAPINAPVNIQSQDKGPKSKQPTQRNKRQGRKDQNDTGSRVQANAQANNKTDPQANDQRTSTEFPNFSPVPFPSRAHAQSDDLAILKPLPKPLTFIEERKDTWDAENQQQLSLIEGEYLDGRRSLQEAYDLMNGMRDKERKEMESRGLVDSAQVRKSLDDAIVFVGSCTDMCPVYERVRRALENNALGLEKGNNGKVIASRAVKAFARPAAGNPPALPSDVRPPSVLVQTLRYLVAEIVPKLPESHAFLWDRTRSIRQDFTFQNFQGPEATWCFEIIARIHIVCLHTMARAASTGTEWSQQQELEQFNKCLQSLSEFYQQSHTDNEPEMRAYAVLSHLFDEELVATFDRLPLQVSRHPLLVLALELRTLALTSVTEFFIRVRKPDIPATFRAILEIHYNELRIQAVRNLTGSLHQRMSIYPFERFVALLGFETDDQARLFCDFYDLTLSTSEEAGEEIDVKAWSEENVRDKRPMAQSFDYSVDQGIAEVDVTKPVELKHSQVNTVSRLLDLQKPKFNAAAPSFTPSSNQIKSPSSRGGLSGASNDLSTGKQVHTLEATSGPMNFDFTVPAKPSFTQEAPQFPVPQITPKLPPTNSALPRSSVPVPAKPSLPEPQVLSSSTTTGLDDPQKRTRQPEPQVPESVIQSIYETAVKAEAQTISQRARLICQRKSFVDTVARSILDSLVSSISAADTAKIVRAVEYDRLRLKKLVIEKIKKKAAGALFRKQESEKQEEELQMFWSRPHSRVVSQRRLNSATPLMSLSPEPPQQQSVEMCVEKEDEDLGIVDEQTEPFSFLPIIPLMRKAYSSGLSKMAIVVDATTKQGLWIQNVVGIGAIPVEVLPGRVATINVVGPENSSPSFDVCLYGDGVKHQFNNVSKDISGVNTLVDLEKALNSALRDWLIWHENDLLHYRSLNVVNVKRRRISHPASSHLDSGCNTTTDSLITAQSSFASQTSERARLRALVADARSLMK